MNFLKKLEEKIFLGKIIRDYGIVFEKQMGIARAKYSVFLTERKGERRLIIRQGIFAFLGASVVYFEFDRTGMQNLKAALDDALGQL